MQPNGATVWGRKTIDSDIFANKPDKWFKIWFYIVNRVNWKDNGKYQRSECFIPSGEIEMRTNATPDQVKKCLSWLRSEHSISTKRSTRGIRIKVLKYNVYQDLNSYSSTREDKHQTKHQRSTDSSTRETTNSGLKIRTKSISSSDRSTREALEAHQTSTTIVEVGNKKNNNCDANASSNEKDMWNRQPEDFEEGVVDADGDGSVRNEVEEQKKADREDRNRIKKNLKLIEDVRGLAYTPQALNADVKTFQQLESYGWTPKVIMSEYIQLCESDYWRNEKQFGKYPTLKTVEYQLRNKQPQ